MPFQPPENRTLIVCYRHVGTNCLAGVQTLSSFKVWTSKISHHSFFSLFYKPCSDKQKVNPFLILFKKSWQAEKVITLLSSSFHRSWQAKTFSSGYSAPLISSAPPLPTGLVCYYHWETLQNQSVGRWSILFWISFSHSSTVHGHQ